MADDQMQAGLAQTEVAAQPESTEVAAQSEAPAAPDAKQTEEQRRQQIINGIMTYTNKNRQQFFLQARQYQARRPVTQLHREVTRTYKTSNGVDVVVKLEARIGGVYGLHMVAGNDIKKCTLVTQRRPLLVVCVVPPHSLADCAEPSELYPSEWQHYDKFSDEAGFVKPEEFNDQRRETFQCMDRCSAIACSRWEGLPRSDTWRMVELLAYVSCKVPAEPGGAVQDHFQERLEQLVQPIDMQSTAAVIKEKTNSMSDTDRVWLTYLHERYGQMLDESTILRAFAIVSCNMAHPRTPWDRMRVGAALYAMLHLFRHSCEPNCTVVYGLHCEAYVVTTRNVKAGESLCVDWWTTDINDDSVSGNGVSSCLACMHPRFVSDTLAWNTNYQNNEGVPCTCPACLRHVNRCEKEHPPLVKPDLYECTWSTHLLQRRKLYERVLRTFPELALVASAAKTPDVEKRWLVGDASSKFSNAHLANHIASKMTDADQMRETIRVLTMDPETVAAVKSNPRIALALLSTAWTLDSLKPEGAAAPFEFTPAELKMNYRHRMRAARERVAKGALRYKYDGALYQWEGVAILELGGRLMEVGATNAAARLRMSRAMVRAQFARLMRLDATALYVAITQYVVNMRLAIEEPTKHERPEFPIEDMDKYVASVERLSTCALAMFGFDKVEETTELDAADVDRASVVWNIMMQTQRAFSGIFAFCERMVDTHHAVEQGRLKTAPEEPPGPQESEQPALLPSDLPEGPEDTAVPTRELETLSVA